ncbi:unnamed protein product [Cuscuta epithymum]|uniref:Transcription repressor n=1 Tax=Cuscuta epithymum TaxID=186058 RepID=A0AAV0GGE1_9ASTE|nr:unnamed protein product [Cuscuta epithymum]
MGTNHHNRFRLSDIIPNSWFFYKPSSRNKNTTKTITAPTIYSPESDYCSAFSVSPKRKAVYLPSRDRGHFKPAKEFREPYYYSKSKNGRKKRSSRVVAMEKASADPEKDFRESMMEMILENGMMEGSDRELEELLACYLSLNSHEYHPLIVKAFQQIWVDLRL